MDKYLMLGLSTVFVIVLFFGFSDGDGMEYELNGIVHDVNPSSTGYTFFIDIGSGETVKCFSKVEPKELERYAINGERSDDGSMYFVQDILELDNYKRPIKN